MRRSDGEMIDVYAVKRGRECDCICPSCKTSMIARQGPVREWHFAHETRQSDTENVCEYSALVSIRLMAHQILAKIDKMYVPPAPHKNNSTGRLVALDSIEVGATFEGQKVDAVATVKGTPLVLYMNYKSRPVPSLLSVPANKKAGVLSIDLPSLWQQTRQISSQTFDRGDFERALVEEVGPKKWVYHPAQVSKLQSPPKRPPRAGFRRHEVVTQQRPPKSRVVPHDDSPLLSRFRCQQCGVIWVAGGSETDANKCHVCKRTTGVRIE